MEENNNSGEDGSDRISGGGGEQTGSRNSFIQSLRVAGEDSLEKNIQKVLQLLLARPGFPRNAEYLVIIIVRILYNILWLYCNLMK